ncbi:MAG TPA: hypothetical protein VEX66_06125 [Microlunatus sp.]|jgi:hypothetical protein|nr:hypothetical protein [Microlunatus sp.]
MRHAVRDALAATVLVVGAVSMLGGCASDSSTDQPPSPSTSQPEPTKPSSTPDQPDTLPPSTTTDRAPLGLEIRYLDENGRFVTVAPEDFPR